MKNYCEMANDVLNRIEEYNTEKQRKRKKAARIWVPAICLCVVAVLGVGVWQSGLFNPKPAQIQEDATIPGIKDWYGPGEDDSQNGNADLIGVIVYNGTTYVQSFSNNIEAENITPDKKIGNGEDFEGTYNRPTEVTSEIYTVKDRPDLLCVKLSNGATVLLKAED